MIPDFKTYIKENVSPVSPWLEDLKNYILDNYVFDGGKENNMTIEYDKFGCCTVLYIPINMYHDYLMVYEWGERYEEYSGRHYMEVHRKYINVLKNDFDCVIDGGYHLMNVTAPKTRDAHRDDVIKCLDLLIDYLDKPALVRVNDGVSESVWGDIRKKSLGQEFREEADVNNMDKDEFFKYLTSRYEYTGFKPEKYGIREDCRADYNRVVFVPIYRYKDYQEPYMMRIDYAIKGKTINKKSKEKIDTDMSIMIRYEEWMNPEPEIFGKLEETFGITDINEYDEEVGRSYLVYWQITNVNNGGVIDNQTVIDVIDFLIDNMSSPTNPVIKKKDRVNESVWGDIRKKSLGQEERLEDNVDLMEGPAFFEYLKKNYKCNTEDTITYNRPDNIINIKLFESKPFIYKYLQYKIKRNEIVTDLPTDEMSKDSSILLNMAKENRFDVEYVVGFHKIYPSNGEVTNMFFLEVLDYIIDQIAEIGPKEIDKL